MEFYMELAATLNLQYWNILLATSTKSQLQAVKDNGGPFFNNYTDVVMDPKWDRPQEIIGDQGKFLSSMYYLLWLN